jgi:O-antigen/teichoic acid export membrane protein
VESSEQCARPSLPERAKIHPLERELSRAGRVNAFGVAARLTQPLLVVALTWSFGPATMGLYLLATSALEMVANFATSGAADAMTIYGSRSVDGASKDEAAADALYRVLGNGFAFAVGLGGLLAAVAAWFAPAIAEGLYPADPQMPAAIRLLAFALPLATFATTACAASCIRLRMDHGVLILGLGRPLFVLGASVLVRLAHGGARALFLATLASYALAALSSAFAFATLFDARRTVASIRSLRLHREMLALAVPQGLHSTLDRFLPRAGVLFLARFGLPPESLALYVTATLFAGNLKEIKTALSAALTPVAARYHGAGDRRSLEEALARVTRSATTLTVPLVAAAMVLRGDVLSLVHASYGSDTRFVALLLALPLLASSYGIAGDCLASTGHGGYVLMNGAVVLVLDAGLSLVLVPAFGLIGAAAATLVATALLVSLQHLELRALEDVRIRAHGVLVPLALSGLVAAGFSSSDLGTLGVSGRVAVASAVSALSLLALRDGAPGLRLLELRSVSREKL